MVYLEGKAERNFDGLGVTYVRTKVFTVSKSELSFVYTVGGAGWGGKSRHCV